MTEQESNEYYQEFLKSLETQPKTNENTLETIDADWFSNFYVQDIFVL